MNLSNNRQVIHLSNYFKKLLMLTLFVGGLATGGPGLAAVTVSALTQSPVNPVPLNQDITYTVSVDNSESSSHLVNINISGVPGESFSSSECTQQTGPTAGTSDFSCNAVAAGQTAAYSFRWTPPNEVAEHNLRFKVSCSNFILLSDPLDDLPGSTLKSNRLTKSIGDSCTAEGGASVDAVTSVGSPGEVQFESASYEGTEGEQVTVKILRVGGSDGPLTKVVQIGFQPGEPIAEVDYTAPGGIDNGIYYHLVEFLSGETEKTISIQLATDSLIEGDELLKMRFEGTSNIGSPDEATLTIKDANSAGNIAFKSNELQVNEDAGEVSIDLIRENGSDGPLSTTVLLGFSGDSAAKQADYTEPEFEQLSLEWGDKDISVKTIKVPIINDNLIEGDELFTAYFTQNAATNLEKASITIVDTSEPGIIQFESSGVVVSESEGEVVLNVLRANGSQGELIVDISVGSEGDIADADSDYGLPSVSQLVWSDGDTSTKNFSIPITNDNVFESDERFTVRLLRNQEVLAATLVTIKDESFTENTGVGGVEIVSGDRQQFDPAAGFDDLVVKVLFSGTQPIAEVPVDWTATPVGSGTFEAARTYTDGLGISSNTFTPLSTQRVVVRATVKLSDASIQLKKLMPRAEGDDPFVEFIINPGIAETENLTQNQESTAIALDSACPALLDKNQELDGELSPGEADLLATCDALKSGDPGEIGDTLNLLAHEEVTAQGTALIETGNLQVMNVNSRLNAIRSGAGQGFDVSGLSLNIMGQAMPNVLIDTLVAGGSAGEESSMFSPWSGFINGSISFGEKDSTLSETGFDFNTVGITAGIDYRLSSASVVGLSLGYGSHHSDLSQDAGNMDMSGLHISGYGTYYRSDRIYIDGLLKVGFNQYDTERRVSSSSDPLQIASADTNGVDYALSVSGGYDYNQGALTLTPYGRIGYVTASIDGYRETASNPGGVGAGSVLDIGSQDVDSLTTVFGGQFSYAVSKPNAVFLPQIRFEWEHEFIEDSREISARFVHDPTSTQFSITSDSPDRDYFNLGLGFSAVAAGGTSGFLYYETRLDQNDVTQHWFKSGIRIEF